MALGAGEQGFDIDKMLACVTSRYHRAGIRPNNRCREECFDRAIYSDFNFDPLFMLMCSR